MSDEMLAVIRLDDHAVWSGLDDRLESPVLHLEHNDAEVGTDDDEVGMAVFDPDA